MKNGIGPQINTDAHGFKHGHITEKVIGIFFDVYNELGYGFLESVYQKSLAVTLNSIGVKACCKIEIPVFFRGHSVGDFEEDIRRELCAT